MLNFHQIFKNKAFLVVFLIVAFLAVGGLVIFNKTKAQLDCSSYDDQLNCLEADCWWNAQRAICEEPITPTPTPTLTSACPPNQETYSNLNNLSKLISSIKNFFSRLTNDQSVLARESYNNEADCLAHGCDWVGEPGYCEEFTPEGYQCCVCPYYPGNIGSCSPSQETYSNEGANWSYQSACYDVLSSVSTAHLDQQFVPPSSYVHLYPSNLPSMTLSGCPDSKMKTQACFVPTPNNGSFVPYFVKQGASYTVTNSCSSCTMSGALQSSSGISGGVKEDVSCGTGSTAPVIDLTQSDEIKAAAQYLHSVSATKGSWSGYSSLNAKITQLEFSADKTKLSKLGEPVTLTFSVLNAPDIRTVGGGGGGGDKSEQMEASVGGETLEEFLYRVWLNWRGSFFPNDSSHSFSLLNNASNLTSSIKNFFSRLTNDQSALALESYNNEADCFSHGCDWLRTGDYNEWTQGYYRCVCPWNIGIYTPVPPPSSQAFLAFYIGNATCHPDGDADDCPFHPNSWYVIIPPPTTPTPTPTPTSTPTPPFDDGDGDRTPEPRQPEQQGVFLKSPNFSYSSKNIFNRLFGLISPSSQAADISTFDANWGPVSLTVYPQSATNFYLAVWGLTGEGASYLLSDPVQVDFDVAVNPFVDLKVQKSPGHEFVDDRVWINSGDDAVLKWDSNDVDSCFATSTPTNANWSGQVLLKNEGLTIPDIATSTTFGIICQGLNGSEVQDSIQVDIGRVNKWVDLNGPSTVRQGSDVVLTWTSDKVSSCIAASSPNSNYWTGNKPTNGTTTIPSLNQTTTFSINCDNGEATDSITVNVVPQVATVDVKARLDGQNWTGPISYQLSGPTTVVGNAPQSFNVQITGSQGDLYTLIYSSGGPAPAAFVGNVSQSIILKPGDNVTLYFDFSTQHLCQQINIKAQYQGGEWSGKSSYLLIGPTILTGNAIPYTFAAVPPGVYYISYISGGPDNFLGVLEGNALSCYQDGFANFTLQFGTVEPTPTPITPPKEIGNNPPTAKIGCVADDIISCKGTIDGDENTPTITLYNASTDPDRDIVTCQWVVQENPQLNRTGCQPLIIGDTPGAYHISLTVIDSRDHSDMTSIVASVQDVSELTPKFVWDPQVPVAGKETKFYDRSLTPRNTSLKTWLWNFEDANVATSTEPNPTVIFNSIGQKEVTLTVTNSQNTTKTISQIIDVRTAAPQWREVIPK